MGQEPFVNSLHTRGYRNATLNLYDLVGSRNWGIRFIKTHPTRAEKFSGSRGDSIHVSLKQWTGLGPGWITMMTPGPSRVPPCEISSGSDPDAAYEYIYNDVIVPSIAHSPPPLTTPTKSPSSTMRVENYKSPAVARGERCYGKDDLTD